MIKNLAIAILVLVVVLMSGALFVVKEGELGRIRSESQ